MPLYFAYGSNMDETAMAKRCPKSTSISPAVLHRHRIAMMAEGYVTIIRDPRAAVYGLLWNIALSDMRALDRYESLHTGLYSKLTQPVKRFGGDGVRPLQQALVYVGNNNCWAPPEADYIQSILVQAARLGFPPAYISELSKLSHGSAAGQNSPLKRKSAGRPLPGAPERDSEGRIKVRPRYLSPLDR